MKSEPLTIEDTTDPQDGERVLRLNGPLLLSNLFEFQTKARTDTSLKLVLDFTNVPYIDSAGIGALVGAYVSRQKENGRSLTLVGVNQRVRQALQVTHVEQFFRFSDAPAAKQA
jgi:anti-sigma B factor antagonist